MVINPIVGVYIPIIRIPIKGGMTIPNIATFDRGTNRSDLALLFFFFFGRFSARLDMRCYCLWLSFCQADCFPFPPHGRRGVQGRFASFFWNRKKTLNISQLIYLHNIYIYIYNIHGGPLPLINGVITPISSFFFTR